MGAFCQLYRQEFIGEVWLAQWLVRFFPCDALPLWTQECRSIDDPSDQTLIDAKWESLALAPVGDSASPDDYFLFTVVSFSIRELTLH